MTVRRVLERAIDALAILTFAGVFLSMLGQVVFRYVLGSPLTWSEELGRYLFVWCAFLGWLIATRKGSHLAMSFVADRLGTRGRAVLDLCFALGAVLLAVVLVRYGIKLAAANWDVPTVTLPVSIGFVYAIVPAAGLAVGAYAALSIAGALRALRGRAGRGTPRALP